MEHVVGIGEMRNAHKNYSRDIEPDSNMERKMIMRKGLKQSLSRHQKFNQIPEGCYLQQYRVKKKPKYCSMQLHSRRR